MSELATVAFGLLLLLICLGVASTLYGWRRFSAIRTRQRRMVRVPAENVHVRVVSVEKVSRFRWTEFSPRVNYTYRYEGTEHTGNRLFLEGELSSENERTVQTFAASLGSVTEVYCDPLLPSFSSVQAEVAPAIGAHLRGLFGGGMAVVVVGVVVLILSR